MPVTSEAHRERALETPWAAEQIRLPQRPTRIRLPNLERVWQPRPFCTGHNLWVQGRRSKRRDGRPLGGTHGNEKLNTTWLMITLTTSHSLSFAVFVSSHSSLLWRFALWSSRSMANITFCTFHQAFHCLWLVMMSLPTLSSLFGCCNIEHRLALRWSLNCTAHPSPVSLSLQL